MLSGNLSNVEAASGWKEIPLYVALFTVLVPGPEGETAGTQLADRDHACTIRFRSSKQSNGTFASPNYPSSPTHSCRYLFTARSKERVQIKFRHFDLVYGAGGNGRDPDSCGSSDLVQVFESISQGNYTKLGTYCGSKLPPMLMSSGRNLEVLFVSSNNQNNNKPGFQAEFRFTSDFGISTGKQRKKSCSFVFHSSEQSSGEFSSPNYPGLYPVNTLCEYTFVGKSNQLVEIHFISVDVDGIPPRCISATKSDFVEYAIGPSLIKRHCGIIQHNIKVMASTRKFKITFFSNEKLVGHGFHAKYKFITVQGVTPSAASIPMMHSCISWYMFLLALYRLLH